MERGAARAEAAAQGAGVDSVVKQELQRGRHAPAAGVDQRRHVALRAEASPAVNIPQHNQNGNRIAKVWGAGLCCKRTSPTQSVGGGGVDSSSDWNFPSSPSTAA